MTALVITDGGRGASGRATGTDAGDCVVRALTIATQEDYGVVYDELAWLSGEMGGRRSARDGVQPKVYRRWLAGRGWVWTPTMQVGQGCQVQPAGPTGGSTISGWRARRATPPRATCLRMRSPGSSQPSVISWRT